MQSQVNGDLQGEMKHVEYELRGFLEDLRREVAKLNLGLQQNNTNERNQSDDRAAVRAAIHALADSVHVLNARLEVLVRRESLELDRGKREAEAANLPTIFLQPKAHPQTMMKNVIVNMFDPATHSSPIFRLGAQHIPGKAAKLWEYGVDVVRCGHLSLLRIHLSRAKEQVRVLSFGRSSANDAAAGGYLDLVRELRSHGKHCTSKGANAAAGNGHLHVIQDLRAHDIHCNGQGADLAAANGHLEVLQDLRAHDICCTSQRTNNRMGFGQDLRPHISSWQWPAANLAAANGHLHVIQDLRAHDIHCDSSGAEDAVRNGHVEVLQDLRAHGISYDFHTPRNFANALDIVTRTAAANGHLRMIQ